MIPIRCDDDRISYVHRHLVTYKYLWDNTGAEVPAYGDIVSIYCDGLSRRELEQHIARLAEAEIDVNIVFLHLYMLGEKDSGLHLVEHPPGVYSEASTLRHKHGGAGFVHRMSQ